MKIETHFNLGEKGYVILPSLEIVEAIVESIRVDINKYENSKEPVVKYEVRVNDGTLEWFLDESINEECMFRTVADAKKMFMEINREMKDKD